jgi:hypothetical protein
MRDYAKRKGKGEQPMLPNRAAVNRLVSGEPWEKSLNNYAKVTPSGEGAIDAPDITDMVKVKI